MFLIESLNFNKNALKRDKKKNYDQEATERTTQIRFCSAHHDQTESGIMYVGRTVPLLYLHMNNRYFMSYFVFY